MFLQNNIIRRRIFLLLIFLNSISYASFHPIYNIYNPEFKFSIENENYKVYFQEERMIDYVKKDGFKFFLPNFTKEYNLSILRFNSIGTIDGYLSSKKFFNKDKILDIQRNDLNYYTTNYKKKFKQLDYLQSNKVIPYKTETSLLIEGTNLPLKKSLGLNKWFYFKFDKKNLTNKLKYLVYSYHMVLDKKYVDAYVKKHYEKTIQKNKDEYKYIKVFIKNISKSKRIIKVNKNNKEPKPKRLNLSRFLFMKEFGYINTNNSLDYKEIEAFLRKFNTDNNEKKLNTISKSLDSVSSKLKTFLNIEKSNNYIEELLDITSKVDSEIYRLNKMGTFKSLGLAFDEKKYDNLKAYFDELDNISDNMRYENYNSSTSRIKVEIEKINNIKNMINEYENYIYTNKDDQLKNIKELFLLKKSKNNCNPLIEEINIECIEDITYVNNYIYYAIKRQKLPEDEFILEYNNGKVINDVAKYYFEIGEYQKSEKFLLKAMNLLTKKEKELVIYNLAVLYGKLNTKSRNEKAVELFKKTSFKEAYFNIFVNYYIGLGVKENDRLAFYYLKKASDEGLKRAIDNYKIMKRKK